MVHNATALNLLSCGAFCMKICKLNIFVYLVHVFKVYNRNNSTIPRSIRPILFYEKIRYYYKLNWLFQHRFILKICQLTLIFSLTFTFVPYSIILDDVFILRWIWKELKFDQCSNKRRPRELRNIQWISCRFLLWLPFLYIS